MVDFINSWSIKCEIRVKRFLIWIGISSVKFNDWKKRYGKLNEHNKLVPRDNWLEEWEKQSIVDFYVRHPEDGYRRVCYMMLDANIVAVSATSVYRVLQNAGVIGRSETKASKKGTGFHQPLKAHDHWHIDVSYINIQGTFYYLCTILDGYSRYIVNWEIGKCMKESDIEIILQKASEKYPNAKARVISDNGPQFISKDFKEYIRLKGMTHVRTSPFYPQSNGKVERWHKNVKV